MAFELRTLHLKCSSHNQTSQVNRGIAAVYGTSCLVKRLKMQWLYSKRPSDVGDDLRLGRVECTVETNEIRRAEDEHSLWRAGFFDNCRYKGFPVSSLSTLLPTSPIREYASYRKFFFCQCLCYSWICEIDHTISALPNRRLSMINHSEIEHPFFGDKLQAHFPRRIFNSNRHPPRYT